MGTSSSKTTTTGETPTQLPPAITASSSSKIVKPVNHPAAGWGMRSLCPVKLPDGDGQNAAPSEISSSERPTCPVKGQKTGEYNVYSQPIVNNGLPTTRDAENSLPHQNQRQLLSTERIASSIPKGSDASDKKDNTWTYPSPQMFWNSLNRKGKIGETKEEEMNVVVAIHNNMNERTWGKVVEWEDVVGLRAFKDDKENQEWSKLLKFIGRPTDLSPKAYIKSE